MAKKYDTHGMAGTPEYHAWNSMRERCYNSLNKYYKHYGGRGISVCKEWRSSFTAFYADMGDRPKGMTLDRIDNNGNYTPNNCRWATRSQQQRNRRCKNKYGIPGLFWKYDKWYCSIKANGKTIYLGNYKDFFEACCARKSAELRYWS